MAKKETTNSVLILLMVVGALLLIAKPELFAINLYSPQVQYTNVPIEARFTTDLADANITAYFNEKELFVLTVNNTNATNVTSTMLFSRSYLNGTHLLMLSNVTEEGVFKFVVNAGNVTETQAIEVRKPYVAVEYSVPSIVERGTKVTLEIRTFTPQHLLLAADAVEVDVYGPDNKKATITFTAANATNSFTKDFEYDKVGNYQFKVHARKDGFATQEVTVITNVIKTEGIHPIVWVWTAAAGLFILLLVIRQVRKRL